MKAGSALPAPAAAEAAATRALLEQLRESESRFRTMADYAPVMLWMAGTDALCDFFNKGWLDFSGRTLAEERYNGWAEAVNAEDFQACMHTYMDSFVERRPFRMEYRLRRHDGKYRWILDTGVPRFSPSGEFAGYIGSCIDITELREAHAAQQKINVELERRVAERTAELRRSNEELEMFAYAASHDLQAPLRTIGSFVGLLSKRYAGQLDAKGAEFVQFITEGTERMQALIQDLLTYSRAGRGELKVAGAVELDVALDRALANLKAGIQESGAKIHREKLPRVPADLTLMTQVFQNLVGNALKFRAAGRAPEIVIAARPAGDLHEILVTDNGIGIEPQHRDRIFRAFQRLHSVDQFPGTGLGLAITKRVIERHGGHIGFESSPGAGTTFRFTLPAAVTA